jgi:hypothetical protein
MAPRTAGPAVLLPVSTVGSGIGRWAATSPYQSPASVTATDRNQAP